MGPFFVSGIFDFVWRSSVMLDCCNISTNMNTTVRVQTTDTYFKVCWFGPPHSTSNLLVKQAMAAQSFGGTFVKDKKMV